MKKKVLLLLRHTKEQFETDTKYIGISKAFINLGYDVFRTYIDQYKIWVTNGEKTEVIGKLFFKNEKLCRNTSLYCAVLNYIQRNNFDYCYIRSIPTTKKYLEMVARLKKSGCKTMVEIPTYPVHGEFESDKWYRKIIRKSFEKNEIKSIKFIDLYLLLGEQANDYLGCPAINIENGVDINIFNPKKHEKTQDFHMVFIGKVARWHGIDRVIEGLNYYYKNGNSKRVYFHVIGTDADGTLKNCKNMVDKYGLEEYVIFEGPKYASEADHYFDISDVAIASLGDHRREVQNISLLKIKEYMARGIPFVYSMDDNMIDESWEFCYKISKDDSPVDIESVIKFAEKIQWECVTSRMRNICRETMGWESQISKVINYFGE